MRFLVWLGERGLDVRGNGVKVWFEGMRVRLEGMEFRRRLVWWGLEFGDVVR